MKPKRFKRFDGAKPSSLQRQAFSALRRGEAVRAHDLFVRAKDFETANRLLTSTIGLVIARLGRPGA